MNPDEMNVKNFTMKPTKNAKILKIFLSALCLFGGSKNPVLSVFI